MIKTFGNLKPGDFVYGIIDRKFTTITIVGVSNQHHGTTRYTVRLNGIEGELSMSIPPTHQDSQYWGVFTTNGGNEGKTKIMSKDFANKNEVIRNNYNSWGKYMVQ